MKKISLKAGSSIANCVIFFAIILVPDIVAAQGAGENVGTRLTAGRLESLAILVVGIVSVVIGWRSMKRSAGGLATNNWKKSAIAALILGLIAVVFAGIHLANTSGGFGTGGGKAGSIVAIIVGSIGIILAAITVYRTQSHSKAN